MIFIKLSSGIRNHIISKSMCVCGATNVLADDLLPNKTVRDTINRFLEANDSSTENAGSVLQIPGVCKTMCVILVQLSCIIINKNPA